VSLVAASICLPKPLLCPRFCLRRFGLAVAWPACRFHRGKKSVGCTGDFVNCLPERRLVGSRGSREPAQLPDELQSRGTNLLVRCGWDEIEQRSDVPAHWTFFCYAGNRVSMTLFSYGGSSPLSALISIPDHGGFRADPLGKPGTHDFNVCHLATRCRMTPRLRTSMCVAAPAAPVPRMKSFRHVDDLRLSAPSALSGLPAVALSSGLSRNPASETRPTVQSRHCGMPHQSPSPASNGIAATNSSAPGQHQCRQDDRHRQ
jgi:hypothetical protein